MVGRYPQGNIWGNSRSAIIISAFSSLTSSRE
jgi:hypothetical protein